MTDQGRKMDMLVVPREEQVFDREEVLGRDAKSVFPTESKTPALDTEAVKAALGSNLRFITETELEAIKAERGGRVEDGSIEPSKPLVEVLREAKEAKEAAFQAVWKSMKVGKNRPLDEDDLQFVEAVLEQDRAKDRTVREEERAALDAYQQAVREAEERQSAALEAGPRAEQQPQPKPAPSVPAAAKRKAAMPLVRGDEGLQGLLGAYDSGSDDYS
ncbi:hypothetical protein WJX75_007982 [Coccomyxa subellipsoidea]|uniref:FAM192A/Fyv6 N-terminal domain-containing protein n=1 Tax=Coccomyxa subellipsoidea TaxID=248742 RepID=A0ABR2YE94_9CHLO